MKVFRIPMGRESNVLRRGRLAAFTTLAVLLLIAGCMGGRTIKVNLLYDPERTPESTLAKGAFNKVVLVPFERGQGVKDDFGRWVGLSGREDIFVSEVPIEEAVTAAARDYLEKAGFDVKNAAPGRSPESYTTPPPDVVVSGVVEEFFTEAASRLGSTNVKTAARLRVFLRNVHDGSVLTVTVEGSTEPRTVVTFEREVFEENAVEVLSDVVERAFGSDKFKKSLRGPAE